MENKKLIIGYDLGDRYSKISWYNEKKNEVENVCMIGGESVSQIPTVLCKIKDDVWLCGQAALDAAYRGQGALISHFVNRYDMEPEIHSDGQIYDKKMLIGIFVRESLKLLETYFRTYSIAYMTVSLKEVNKKIMNDIMESATMWGVGKDCIRVQSNIASFEYYALSQKKELWQHDVGLFEYDEDGMNYYHLSISRGRHPVVVRAQAVPLKMYMNGGMLKKLSPIDLDRQFLDVLNQVFSQKIISTVYLTGKGFKGGWMNLSLRKMCNPGRRVFVEDNIYAAGACYSGSLDVSQNNFKQFVALNDDIVPFSIYIRGSKMKEMIRKELVSGGSSWYSIDHQEKLLLDGTDTVVLHVKDFISNAEKLIPLKLEGLPDRPNKTIRIALKIQFESTDICCITMQDEGFGGIFPSSKRTWRKQINVAEYESDKEFKEEGRILFGRELTEKIPYYFNLSNTKVYSLEEFCYYVYNNIYTITKDTFGEELFYWIEKSLKEPALAKGFKNLKKTGASFKAMVQHLMTYTDYYSNEECARLNYVLDEIEHQNPVETRKIKADNLVHYCRYIEAISEYTIVVGQMEKAENADVTKQFKGNVYHNLACAYMRVMNFESAAINYKKAYDLNKNQESLKCYLWALKMCDDESGFFDATSEYHLTEKYIESVLKEYEETRQGISMGQHPENEAALRVLKQLKAAYRS